MPPSMPASAPCEGSSRSVSAGLFCWRKKASTASRPKCSGKTTAAAALPFRTSSRACAAVAAGFTSRFGSLASASVMDRDTALWSRSATRTAIFPRSLLLPAKRNPKKVAMTIGAAKESTTARRSEKNRLRSLPTRAFIALIIRRPSTRVRSARERSSPGPGAPSEGPRPPVRAPQDRRAWPTRPRSGPPPWRTECRP